ncbi:MAG: sigma 54-interacting transcriptional regulator [Planctomycetaceae bacterium]
MITTESRLLVHQAGGPPSPFDLRSDRPQAIGRGADCDLRLNDEHCSRVHCTIHRQGSQWIISDRGSRNGTLVNGDRVQQAALEEGDVIVVGSTWLVFSQTSGEDDTSDLTPGSESETSLKLPSLSSSTRSIPTIPVRPPRPPEPVAPEDSQRASADDTWNPRRAVPARRRVAPIEPILGESPAIRSLLMQIAHVAPTESTVLIRGESGAGKELVARAIHAQSRRRDSRFVCVNCAALTESLLESELFGHEKGAFTGATEQKRGKFEQADHGTLLLDEIGEMSPTIQAKFLRVLEGHSFERVGGHVSIQTDVRVIAATNLDLESAVREGSFRRDLYFRLNVVPIEIPPLRARKEDVPILAKYFIEQFARQQNRSVPKLTAGALDRLTTYDWPGNVRELRNSLERAMILGSGDSIEGNDISYAGLDTQPIDESKFEGLSLEVVEMQHILRTLKATRWNKSKAASILGIERSTLDRKLKRHDVQRPDEFT